MKSAVVAAALLLAVPVAASAAPWIVDPAHSTIAFSGVQTGTSFQGHFKTFTAAIDFDPKAPQNGHAKVTIDMASATTGDPQRDGALPGTDWFAIKQFPTAIFEASQFRATGGNAYEAVGRLTLRGVSRDCVLPFTLTQTGRKAEAKGRLQIVRTTFGVGQGAWSTGQWVALEVGIDIDIVAEART